MNTRAKLTVIGALAAGAVAQPGLAQDAGGLEALPDELQALYTDPIAVSVAEAVPAPGDGPWLWCHSESYMGNPWRVTMNEELARLVGGAVEEGLVSELLVFDSNDDTTQQIAQIRNFIDRGCDIVTTIAGSSTALDDAIGAAIDAGIPVVSTAGAVGAPGAVNVMHNQNLWGRSMGEAIAAALPEGGTILQVEGISGHPLVQQENAGLETAVAEAGNLEIARTVSGEWTASTTKSAVLQALATTPQPIDAVWSTGSETRVIAEAFAQAGRELPLVTGSISGDALGYWNENKDGFRFVGGEVSPHIAAQNAYRVGIRILSGQTPLVDTIIAPMPAIAQADLPDWYQECLTPASGSLFPIPPQNPFPDELMDGYFEGGSGTPAFDYAATPQPCG